MSDASGHTQPREPASFAELPTEVLLVIVRLSLAVGRERDISALARVNKKTYCQLSPEMYALVVKYKTFDLVHWSMRKRRLDTLRTALAYGADPNQIWAPSHYTMLPTPRMFRPAGWGLNTPKRLGRALNTQTGELTSWVPPRPAEWGNSWFSAPDLSKVHTRELSRFWVHFLSLTDPETSAEEREDDTRLYDLSAPVDGSLAISDNMPWGYMDQRDVKIRFLQLFHTWTYPLHTAALTDQHEAAQALLASGAEVDSVAVDVCFCHPHKMPSSEPHVRETDILVAYTPLHVAICRGKWETAKVLLANGAQQIAKVFSGIDDRDWLPDNALHAALSKGRLNYDFIEFLLDNGYDARLEERDNENVTPLGIACNSVGDPARDDVVRLLLRYGADIENQVPSHGQARTSSRQFLLFHEMATPAVCAVRNGRFGLARLLLEEGADPSAKSSNMQVTMLHSVCSRHGDEGVTPGRIELFDLLLANSTAEDLNAFDATGCTPLSMLIKWNFRGDPGLDLGYMESELLRNGADIMAGMTMGKNTPFDYMIKAVMGLHYDALTRPTPNEIYKKVLATVRRSRIHQNRHRPVAFLSQLWRHVGRALNSHAWTAPPSILERIPPLLQGLIRGGFSPAEIDRHGNTAMISFLKYLIAHPLDLMRSYPIYYVTEIPHQGRLVQTIMAILQENGAALYWRNREGLTAFHYLDQLINCSGNEYVKFEFGGVVGRLVQPGRDEHGNACFKFHPTLRLFGAFSEDDITERMRGNRSRWLLCEDWCYYRCQQLGGPAGRCSCARGPFETPARCDDDCCERMRRRNRTLNLPQSWYRPF